MSIYVYRPQSSTSARQLAQALGGSRVRYYEGGRFFKQTRMGHRVPIHLRPEDAVVCWGVGIEGTVPPPGVRLLNKTPLRNKMSDALALRAAGVSTIEVSRTRPAPLPPGPTPVDPAIALWERAQDFSGEFNQLLFTRSAPTLAGVVQLRDTLTQLHGVLGRPAPTAPPVTQVEWLGRRYDHVGGNDLLTPTPNPQYWVKKETLVKEFRVHSFQGLSIRAGVKKLRDGFGSGQLNPGSSWIRSWDGGWRISYDGVTSRQAHRDLAAAACRVLGLDFAAVDIGERADGSLVVLECNRAPGIEAGTIDCYVRAVQGWAA